MTRLAVRIDELRRAKPGLVNEVATADDDVRAHSRARDDAAEELRAEGLSATTDGPLPEDDQDIIKARLSSVEEAIAGTAVDPELHATLRSTRQKLADTKSRLDANSESRVLAEQFADADGARHTVALDTSVKKAGIAESTARGEAAKAEAQSRAGSRGVPTTRVG